MARGSCCCSWKFGRNLWHSLKVVESSICQSVETACGFTLFAFEVVDWSFWADMAQQEMRKKACDCLHCAKRRYSKDDGPLFHVERGDTGLWLVGRWLHCWVDVRLFLSFLFTKSQMSHNKVASGKYGLVTTDRPISVGFWHGCCRCRSIFLGPWDQSLSIDSFLGGPLRIFEK
jgi:hypothetical protein